MLVAHPAPPHRTAVRAQACAVCQLGRSPEDAQPQAQLSKWFYHLSRDGGRGEAERILYQVRRSLLRAG